MNLQRRGTTVRRYLLFLFAKMITWIFYFGSFLLKIIKLQPLKSFKSSLWLILYLKILLVCFFWFAWIQKMPKELTNNSWLSQSGILIKIIFLKSLKIQNKANIFSRSHFSKDHKKWKIKKILDLSFYFKFYDNLKTIKVTWNSNLFMFQNFKMMYILAALLTNPKQVFFIILTFNSYY